MNAARSITGVSAITEFELRRVFHDPSQIFIRAIQPLLWLVVFGAVMAKVRVLPTTDYSYLQFLTPGVLAQSVVFMAIFLGANLVWERDRGLLHKLLSTPIPRQSIIIGKALSAGVRSIFQATLICILALVINVDLSVNPVHILGVMLIVVLAGMCFSSLSICLASLFKTRERMMGIGQAITMPLFFASSAIYPLDLMPGWLRVMSRVNPLTYVVDALRALLLTGDFSHLVIDVGIAVASVAILVSLAVLAFRRIIE
ncbi:MAG: ABC transporter permease [Dehalococcoidales bacterium]|nr:ABC transporter permease [Dehalococcoidales bacterium]